MRSSTNETPTYRAKRVLFVLLSPEVQGHGVLNPWIDAIRSTGVSPDVSIWAVLAGDVAPSDLDAFLRNSGVIFRVLKLKDVVSFASHSGIRAAPMSLVVVPSSGDILGVVAGILPPGDAAASTLVSLPSTDSRIGTSIHRFPGARLIRTGPRRPEIEGEGP